MVSLGPRGPLLQGSGMMNVKPGIICLYHHRVGPRRGPMGSRHQVHLDPLARAMQALGLDTHRKIDTDSKIDTHSNKSTRIPTRQYKFEQGERPSGPRCTCAQA